MTMLPGNNMTAVSTRDIDDLLQRNEPKTDFLDGLLKETAVNFDAEDHSRTTPNDHLPRVEDLENTVSNRGDKTSLSSEVLRTKEECDDVSAPYLCDFIIKLPQSDSANCGEALRTSSSSLSTPETVNNPSLSKEARSPPPAHLLNGVATDGNCSNPLNEPRCGKVTPNGSDGAALLKEIHNSLLGVDSSAPRRIVCDDHQDHGNRTQIELGHSKIPPNGALTNQLRPLEVIRPESVLPNNVLKLHASAAEINADSTNLSGLVYRSSISSLTTSVPKPSMLGQQVGAIFMKDNTGMTIGPKIKSSRDIILNDSIDLNSAVSPFSRVTVTDSSREENFCERLRPSWILLALGSAVAMTLAVIALMMWAGWSEQSEAAQPESAPLANYTLRFIPKGQWNSVSEARIRNLKVDPARLLIVSHTADYFCDTPTACTKRVLAIESWHIQIGYRVIGYNFLIGGDGHIYEGRGWGKEGAHSYRLNCNSIGVGFIGNFERDNITALMIDAFDILAEEGVRRGSLTRDYQLFGHHQVSPDAVNPGENIKKLITSWPHWTEKLSQEERVC